ncbi:hypothetical protein DGG96_16095 [Legionella qingyii]|uniref:Uncharacterized protein n=1 Tax=Legionella qingyii TaxID=2184757 RepID=A0A317U2J6_9GAMM|nr:hypothetical protein DGG96_18460 [Legionella qingyii]PWY54530.1 hypothetical protein DGG96_16095 [Legionella qingyii]
MDNFVILFGQEVLGNRERVVVFHVREIKAFSKLKKIDEVRLVTQQVTQVFDIKVLGRAF